MRLLFLLLSTSCVSMMPPSEPDCEPDFCPDSLNGGELCCGDTPWDGEFDCWYRADGKDYRSVGKYVDYCYGY